MQFVIYVIMGDMIAKVSLNFNTFTIKFFTTKLISFFLGLNITCMQKLKDLVGTKESQGFLPYALLNSQRHGDNNLQSAHTTSGKLEQAFRWLDNPNVDDGGVGNNNKILQQFFFI